MACVGLAYDPDLGRPSSCSSNGPDPPVSAHASPPYQTGGWGRWERQTPDHPYIYIYKLYIYIYTYIPGLHLHMG